MNQRQAEEAEEAARIESMTDEEVARCIRAYLARCFIGPALTEHEETKEDGTTVVVMRHEPHRFVRFFDELWRRHGDERLATTRNQGT